MMAKLFLHLSIFTLIFLTACNGIGSKATPGEVAKSYLSAMNKADYEAAKKLGTEQTKSLVDFIASFKTTVSDTAIEISALKKVEIIKDTIVEENRATVTYKESDSPDPAVLNLVKIDGKWLVNQSIENNNAGTPLPSDEVPSSNPDEAVDDSSAVRN
jgi:Domain of unknown function (DUF4878)